MDISKIHTEVGEVLDLLKTKNLEPQEKIAILKSASSFIENIIAVESMVVMMANMLTKK